MASEDAFFEFGTNAPEVARLIASSLGEIRTLYGQTGAALAAGSSSKTFLDDLVGRLRSQVAQANAELAKLGTGVGGADARRALFAQTASSITQQVQAAQAASPPPLRTFDYAQLGREAVGSFEGQLRQGRYSNINLRGATASFEADIAVLAQSRDAAQQAIIDGLRDKAARINPAALAAEQRAALAKTLTSSQYSGLVNPEVGARGVAPSLSSKQLTSLVGGGVIEPFSNAETEKISRQTNAAQVRFATAQDRAAAATAREADAAEKLAAAEAKRAAELATERRLISGLASGETVKPSPTSPYSINNGQVYERMAAGGARLVESESKRLGILAAQDALLQKQVVTQEKQLALQNRSPLQAFSSGFFSSHFSGETDGAVPSGKTAVANIAQTAGSAARYTLAYGGLFAVSSALKDTLAEAVDFTDSFTDLKVAVHEYSSVADGAAVVTNSWINSLSDLSRLAGGNVGQSIDAAARGVRAFIDDVDTASTGAIQSAGTAISQASTQLALIGGKEIGDAAGDVIAIGQAFELTAEQTVLAVDAISTAKQLGGAPGEIENGLAGIAVTAKEAGFSLQETANLVSVITAQTDQTGVAVATRLSRVFSILSGSTGQSLLSKLQPVFDANKIDPGETIREQLFAVGKVYQDVASPDLQGVIRNQLGGTANTRELLAFFDSMEKIKNAELQAGAGAAEFARKSNDLVGTLRKIQGTITGIQTGLVQSDLLAPIGALIKGLEVGLQVLNQTLQLYNLLPSSIKGFTAAILESIAAYKIFQAIRSTGIFGGGAGGGIVSGLFGGPRVAAENSFTGQIVTAGSTRAAAEATVTAEVQTAGQAFAATIARMAATTAEAGAVLTGAQVLDNVAVRKAAYNIPPGAVPGVPYRSPYAIPTGSAPVAPAGIGARIAGSTAGTFIKPYLPLIAIGAALGVVSEINKVASSVNAINSFAASSSQTVSDVSVSGDYATAADALRSNAETLDTGQSGLSAFFTSEQRRQALDSANSAAAFLDQQDARIVSEQRLSDALQTTSVFGDPAARGLEELNAGLEELATVGVGSHRQLRLLVQSFKEDPNQINIPGIEETAGKFATGINTALAEALGKFADDDGLVRGVAAQAAGGSTGRAGGAQGVVQTGYLPQGVADRVAPADGDFLDRARAEFLAELSRRGISSGDVIDRNTLKKIAATVIANLGLDLDNFANLGPELNQALVDALVNGESGLSPKPVGKITKKLSDQQITERVQKTLEATNAAVAVATTDEGRLSELQFGLQAIDSLANKALDGTTPGALIEARTEVVRQIADTIANQFEQDRKRIVTSSKSISEARRRTQRLARQTLQRLAQLGRGSEDQVLALLEQIGKQGAAAVAANLRSILIDARAAYQAALVANRAARAAAAIASRELGVLIASAPSGADKSDLIDAQKDYQRYLDQQAKAGIPDQAQLTDGYDSGADAADAANSAADAAAKAAALFAAKANASAAEQGTSLAQAKADLAIAQYNLEHAKEGTAEYYDALAAYYQAQDALAEAIRAEDAARLNAQSARLGGSLNTTRNSLISARKELRAQEEGSTEYYDALAAYYQAQAAFSDAVLEDARTRALLRNDITDPIAQARIELRIAERQLKRDLDAGKDQQTIRQDKLEIKQSGASLEQTKFDAFLSDLQTQEQLGQITFQQYVKYLEAERNRLRQIRHKTQQQQDQLNQINLLLQSASESLDGQFNLGSIKLPTVYEARRFMKENLDRLNAGTGGSGGSTGGLGGSGSGSGGFSQVSAQQVNSNNRTMTSIKIDGADTREVRRILVELLGPTVVNGTATRKIG